MTESWLDLIEAERELDEPLTWSDYHIYAVGDGYEVTCSTNDDNDDGWPDGEIATWSLTFDSLEQALRHTGTTRTGFYGQPVRVYLDGRPYRKESH